MIVYVFYTCRSRILSHTEGYGDNFRARKMKPEIKLHKNSFSEKFVNAFLSIDYNDHIHLYSIQRRNSIVKGHEN